MNAIEAIEALKQGKRIKKSIWVRGCFIYLDKDLNIRNQNNECASFEFISLNDEWLEIPSLSWKDLELGTLVYHNDMIYLISFINDFVVFIVNYETKSFGAYSKPEFEGTGNLFEGVI